MGWNIAQFLAAGASIKGKEENITGRRGSCSELGYMKCSRDEFEFELMTHRFII